MGHRGLERGEDSNAAPVSNIEASRSKHVLAPLDAVAARFQKCLSNLSRDSMVGTCQGETEIPLASEEEACKETVTAACNRLLNRSKRPGEQVADQTSICWIVLGGHVTED
jgi:hypothetical protein